MEEQMKTVTIDTAMNDLKSMVHYTLKNNEEINIASDEGSVVMLSYDDYMAMKETLHLIADKKSLKALLSGHLDRDEGRIPDGKTLKEVFSDL